MKNKFDGIEINGQFRKTLDLLENTRKNVFITGKAGTGKSTLLQYFRSITKKKVVVLAPTGVAALNVQGETIHSFFGFKPGVTMKKIERVKKKKTGIYQELDAIIIDEISARESAKSLGIKPIGSLRVLLIAYKNDLISRKEVDELLTQMINSKYRLSPNVLNEFWNLFEKMKR